MMIRRQDSPLPLFYAAHEIARPAARNFYLRLQAAVPDWEALAAPFAAAFSATMGRPTDPVVYLKILLLGYLENITYDTDLAERVADSIAIREFLGYDLTEAPPDHSSISRNRAHIAQVCSVEAVLAQVVALCVQAGLVSAEEVAVDATLVPANASLSSLRSVRTGKSVRDYLQQVREENAQAQAAGEPKKQPAVSNAEFRSSSDPDARIAQKPGSPRDMYYKATHVTDAKGGIILAADCALADEADTQAATPALAQARQTLAAHDLRMGTVVADAGYDDADFHAAVEQLGAAPLTNYKPDTTRKPEGLKKADFPYDAEADCYQCPAGKRLRFVGVDDDRRRYRARAADCADCPHKAACLGAATARTIYRHQHESSRERNLARCHTDAGRQALRRRRHTVEPPFGHMKTYGGLRLLNCRGRRKSRVKVILAAAARNLTKLAGALAARAAQGTTAAKDTMVSVTVHAFCTLRAAIRLFLRGHVASSAPRPSSAIRPQLRSLFAIDSTGLAACSEPFRAVGRFVTSSKRTTGPAVGIVRAARASRQTRERL